MDLKNPIPIMVNTMHAYRTIRKYFQILYVFSFMNWKYPGKEIETMNPTNSINGKTTISERVGKKSRMQSF